MPCEVEYTDEFSSWWDDLGEPEQISVAHVVRCLSEQGVALARPLADTLRGSKYPNMRELRIQHEGRPYRVLYVFDPRRRAVLLIGGDKTGDKRWYEKMVPWAEEIYVEHLRELAAADEIRGKRDG
jgi:hypothetical protein